MILDLKIILTVRLTPTERTQIRDAFVLIGHAQRKASAPKTSRFQQRTQKLRRRSRCPGPEPPTTPDRSPSRRSRGPTATTPPDPTGAPPNSAKRWPRQPRLHATSGDPRGVQSPEVLQGGELGRHHQIQPPANGSSCRAHGSVHIHLGLHHGRRGGGRGGAEGAVVVAPPDRIRPPRCVMAAAAPPRSADHRSA